MAPGRPKGRRSAAALACAAAGAFVLSGAAGDLPASGALKDLRDEVELSDTCDSCLAKGGGWCIVEQRCVEDDVEHCDADSLIGLAGFTNDCSADWEARRPKGRPWIDKGVLVSYTFENGTCCMDLGIVHRAYHELQEYAVLLRNSSREEVKTERWNRRKPAKKKDEGSEYHDMEFRYFKPQELTVISGIRPGDVVEAHFAIKQKGATEDLVMSKRTEPAIVLNTTVDSVAVNFTSDFIVSILPREFVVDRTNESRPEQPATHDEL
eukprot:TRINITY_DN9978_c0_g3_i1.p1 TRINITY_DN9978_c0_g3~~TRINITY_DN9978_c0_g3_i1.p1  ORF type:complete len:294 (+),score=70.38 TRINITY_DN9978_c0_g3_i1:85-882(+)